MLGTFAPQKDAYVETLEEETTPSGILARGIYTAKLRVSYVLVFAGPIKNRLNMKYNL